MQKIVLLLGQLHRAAVFCHRERHGVDRQAARRDETARTGRRAVCKVASADVGLDSGHQLAHGKWLGHVVIRARLQPKDLVGLLFSGGQHDDGHRAAAVTKRRADLKAVHLRQHHVQ